MAIKFSLVSVESSVSIMVSVVKCYVLDKSHI